MLLIIEFRNGSYRSRLRKQHLTIYLFDNINTMQNFTFRKLTKHFYVKRTMNRVRPLKIIPPHIDNYCKGPDFRKLDVFTPLLQRFGLGWVGLHIKFLCQFRIYQFPVVFPSPLSLSSMFVRSWSWFPVFLVVLITWIYIWTTADENYDLSVTCA